MNRFKRHKVKREKPEPSASYTPKADEHDLAYYIHDRVELMHQVFSVLKHKELRAIAPECVRHISIDDLQELCTEELLGISSKRLCAILDGAEPPSDTESSSQSEPEPLETISLDSISSDEEILSQSSKKKKHKHRRSDSKSKSKKKRNKSKEPEAGEDEEKSKASRAGLTVLELLELQARARAIRAQLQQEQAQKQAEAPPAANHRSSASENEVEIKEEPPEVVEISSDEEKPKIEELEKALPKAKDDTNKKGVDVEVTSKDKEANKSKEKKNKKDKSKKSKKEKENKKKVPDKHTKDRGRDENDQRKIIENVKNTSTEEDNSQKVTKKINDLIITVPQQHSRKIRLNRNKVTVSVTNNASVASVENSNHTVSVMSPVKQTDVIRKPIETIVKSTEQVANKQKEKVKDRSKKKQKRKERKKSTDKDTSDHDEITLQLSDSEKMDLLEDFDRRNLDKVTSSSEDSDSSSDSNSDSSQKSSKDNTVDTCQSILMEKDDNNSNKNIHDLDISAENNEIESKDKSTTKETTSQELSLHTKVSNTCVDSEEKCKTDKTLKEQNEIHVTSGTDLETADNHNTVNIISTTDSTVTYNIDNIQCFISSNNTENSGVVNNINDMKIREDNCQIQISEPYNKNITAVENDKLSRTEKILTRIIDKEKETAVELLLKSAETDTENIQHENTKFINESDGGIKISDTAQDTKKNLSEGEVSSNESSEVEACELKPEVVCISDENSDSNRSPKKKKNKKKEKKSKKEKKARKSKSDFQKGADQNFYTDVEICVLDKDEKNFTECVSLDDDNAYEIMELSDDSSCYEVEGTVLSKEPTAEEIKALSAKIDEIEREEIVTDEQIKEHERKIIDNRQSNENSTEFERTSEDKLESISWKDRYLESKKVKTVLTTSNMLNALRKKNKELKNKLEESKKQEQKIRKIEESTVIPAQTKKLEEGSIQHYNTLQGSTKYVNPVPDPVTVNEFNTEIQVTGELKKDAKLLLKMYKKLLKYNDITKPKDPNKKKKKKLKKKEKNANVINTSSIVTGFREAADQDFNISIDMCVNAKNDKKVGTECVSIDNDEA